MKVLLTTLNAKYIHTNLAIRLLYQLYKDKYAALDWKEYTIKEDQDDVAAQCSQYEVVAFSCYIWNITQTLQVAEKIKALGTSTKILLGGPEVSYDWEDIIAHESVDFIITGEGETPFGDFLAQYPNVQNVANVVSKVDKKVQYFQFSGPFDLTGYADIMPYADDDPVELANKVLYVETSRGCPYKCEFCLASLDNKVRYLPSSNIQNTLHYVMQHGRVVKFLDRTFNIKKDFTIATFEYILAHYKSGNVFQFEITADILHPDIVQYILDKVPSGLFRFEIGIQTVNQKANLEVSRKQNFDKTVSVIKKLQHKVEMHLDLIVGLPHDYWDDNKYSFEEVFKLYPPELQLGFLKFLKGTPMLHKHKEHDYVFDPAPPYQIIRSKYLSEEELAKIVTVEHALEIYWNKNRAQHTLKYVCEKYSIFDFFLALGEVFGRQHSFHKYGLRDVFDVLLAMVKEQYPTDAALQELVTIDYYLYHRRYPGSFGEEAFSSSEKLKMLDQMHLNHRKYRYQILPISFDFEVFKDRLEVLYAPSLFIVQYDGVNEATTSQLTSSTPKR